MTWKNYFYWPLVFLVPLMILDAFSTTFALSIGHVEKNPLVAGIVMNPHLHLAVKILFSVNLLPATGYKELSPRTPSFLGEIMYGIFYPSSAKAGNVSHRRIAACLF
ncbi:MAG: DUF5658 family protein [Methanoregulaceae archaeon]|nr:DUF5658 family protein [Methanoregulaceae archaeon]